MSALRRCIPLLAQMEKVLIPRLSPFMMQKRVQFCSNSTLKVLPGCDLIYESANAKAVNQPVNENVEKQVSDKNMSITFTCNVCKTRTQKFFSKLAYTRGLIIIRCPGCQSLHLIADNLGWIKEKTPWRIGDQKHLLVSDSLKPKTTIDPENSKAESNGDAKSAP